MRSFAFVLCLVSASCGLCAQAADWQPSPGHSQVPLWPGKVPDAQAMPGPEYLKTEEKERVAGKPYLYLGNITQPTLTVYSPTGRNTGAAVVVIPGGGFQILAMDLEGTEVCDWLTASGISCVLLKYRVPSLPYDWRCDCRPDDLVVPAQSLEDVQRAMGLVRLHAAEWHIDPHKVGVLGFSAGGYLVAEISTHFKRRLYPVVDAADKESCRPDFAVAIYPGHIVTHGKLNPNVPVTGETPPTFLVQAEDDGVDGVDESLVYYAALKQAGVPVEMHLYAQGGHAFGLRPTRLPITHWPDLVIPWLKTIGMIP
ncbi:MAG TPA: alpha/beta hydrolase [Gammaproteobacteria bacterium]|nr:alpha/beta hydrolase [Gammaproteobacteria bacterium]